MISASLNCSGCSTAAAADGSVGTGQRFRILITRGFRVSAAGWYKPKRVVEVASEKPMRVRLLEVIERGIDFERATYERLPD